MSYQAMLAELRRNIADAVADGRHIAQAKQVYSGDTGIYTDAYIEGLTDALKIASRHTPRLEREVTVRPAFDCLTVQPCAKGGQRCAEGAPGANHGRGVALVHFALFDETAEVRLVVGTGWHHPATPADIRQRYNNTLEAGSLAELGFHSAEPFPAAIGATVAPEHCPRGWATCHSSVEFSNAEPGVEQLITGGTDALWRWLEDRWNTTFGSGADDQ